MTHRISVQAEDFDIAQLTPELHIAGETGAKAIFIGSVRDFRSDSEKDEREPAQFYLEHYPGMCENILTDIVAKAEQRWRLQRCIVVHRVGELGIDDQIVFVGVSSAHRAEAFAACEFIIDLLKTQAPFWKRENGQWLGARRTDETRAEAWLAPARTCDTPV